MTVNDVMSKKMHCCTPIDSTEDAAQLMRQNDVGSLPVVESPMSNRLVGTITDRDICLKVVGEGKPARTPVGTVMTRSVITCAPEDSLSTCESLMQEHQIRRIPVVDKRGKCIGIVAQADIAARENPEHVKRTVGAISQPRRNRVPPPTTSHPGGAIHLTT